MKCHIGAIQETPVQTTALARHWLAQCLNSHSIRETNKDDFKVPTRLISVTAGDCVKLVNTHELADITPNYATLSYCWGNKPFIKLTMATLKEFLVAIPMEQLPLTFFDAIKITRELEIDYIWIDALCII